MPETNDIELLQRYAKGDAEEAFAELVTRHVNLVYSAALRCVGNRHQAEEITQAVFIILARKARNLRQGTVLSGWLYQTARLTAANHLRTEIRRARREQEAYMQSLLNEPETGAWTQIVPLLDSAMGNLSEQDRNAVVLRFFEGRSLNEVGTALGASEDAAKMRVNRALEKLRKFFTRRGVTLSAAAIAGAVSSNSVQAAPAGLAASAVAAVKGSAVTASTFTLAKGMLKVMAWTKAKTAIVAGISLILATGTTTVVVRNLAHGSRTRLSSTPVNADAFEAESARRINSAKQWGLAILMFASDHKGQVPGDFAEAKAALRGPGSNSQLLDANFEIVSSGNMFRYRNPMQTILIREKEPRPSPDGGFVKIYTFADGHVQMERAADGDFEALEKQRGYVIEQAKN